METLKHISKTMLAAALFIVLNTGNQVEAADEASWADVKQAYVVQGDDDTAYIAFSPEALQRAGKRIKDAAVADNTADLSANEARGKSRIFKPRGKAGIGITDDNDIAERDDYLEVAFEVPSGAVGKNVEITMTVYGNYLSDLIVAFQPAGLVFRKDAVLKVVLGPKLVNVDAAALQVWHEHGDGTVEDATLYITPNRGNEFLTIQAAVSGFSRYGIRRSF